MKTFLWVVIAILAGAIVWLLAFGGKDNGRARIAEITGDSEDDTSVSQTPPKPAPLSETANEEQMRLRRSVLSGNYGKAPSPREDKEPSLDIVYLKNGRKLRGRILSRDEKSVVLQVSEGGEARNIPQREILKIASERDDLMNAALKASGPGSASVDRTPGEGDGEKSELRMTAAEWQAYQVKKRQERLDNRQQQGGIRALHIAREVREEAEKRDKEWGVPRTRKEDE